MKLGTSMFLMVLILVVQLSTRVKAVPNTNIVYNVCWDTGDPLGPYADAVRHIRHLMKTRTHTSNYDYRTGYEDDNGVECYGRAWCRRELASEDCRECVRAADTLIITKCPDPLRALMGLVDCGMRIDNLPITDE